MNRLELLVPPPLVMLVSGLLMWLISALLPVFSLAWLYSPALGAIIGSIFGLLGVAISLTGILTFKRLRTTVDPRRPAASSRLATSGVYRYSRNPMYLGVLLILIGWAFVLGNWLSALVPIVFIAYITRYQILPEEQWLQKKFGSDFLEYKRTVRRWI